MTTKNYDSWDKSRLIEEIQKLSSRKKYGLVWEDKPEDVVEQCKEQLPVLEEVEDRVIEKDSSDTMNYIIEGDNYHALSVLNYTHAGKVDVIYIDPPYNTGAKDWKYNNDYVDSEDPWRHSKWLSMMDKRLKFAKSLLKKQGALIVAIDDYEVATLGLLLDELFPNFVKDIIIVKHHPQGAGSNTISRTHEYAYILTPEGVGIPGRVEQAKKGKWSLRRSGQGENNWRAYRPNQFFAVLVDEKKGEVVGVDEALEKGQKYPLDNTESSLKRIYPIDTSGRERVWRYNRETMSRLIQEKKIEYTGKGNLVVLKDKVTLAPIFSIWDDSKYNAGIGGSGLLTKIMGEANTFPYPKSIHTVYEMIAMFIRYNKQASVVDFFAGSGTTGHAVLELNKADGGRRRFILCTNNENGIAEEVTYPRIKKVMNGYGDTEGIPANLRYYKTTFVQKSEVTDDTRRELIRKSTEMICLKEDTFKKVYDNKKYKIYRNSKRVTGILFDLDSLDEFKVKLDDIDLPASIYVFSLTSDAYDEDFSDLNIEHKLQPIPEGILEVYRKIFA
jgi:adenine-specific DNA-methyltransferase